FGRLRHVCLAAVTALIMMISSTTAFAQGTYYLYLDQTGAQTQIDVTHTTSWYITVLSGSFVFGGGHFQMKKGSSASANGSLTLYQGSNTTGTVLGQQT